VSNLPVHSRASNRNANYNIDAAARALLEQTDWQPPQIGLASIVGGTLPLELFGREGYGGAARMGLAESVAPLISFDRIYNLSSSPKHKSSATQTRKTSMIQMREISVL